MSFGYSNDAIYQTGNNVWNIRLNGVGAATASSSSTHLELFGPGDLRLGAGGAERMSINAAGTVTLATPLPVASGGTGTTTGASSITLASAQASTSGTSKSFTGIPSGVNRITIMFSGVSTNGVSLLRLRVGAGSTLTSGYDSLGIGYGAGSSRVASTAGFDFGDVHAAANIVSGSATLSRINGNDWVIWGGFKRNASTGNTIQGDVNVGGTLDRIIVTTVNGSDSFDAGTLNINYET